MDSLVLVLMLQIRINSCGYRAVLSNSSSLSALLCGFRTSTRAKTLVCRRLRFLVVGRVIIGVLHFVSLIHHAVSAIGILPVIVGQGPRIVI